MSYPSYQAVIAKACPYVWASIDTLYLIAISFYNFLLKVRQFVVKYYPSSVFSVIYMDLEKREYTDSSTAENCYVVFRVWDKEMCEYREFCLSADHVKEALGIPCTSLINHLKGAYIVERLKAYHVGMEILVKQRKLFEFTYAEQSMLADLKPYEASLYMTDNLTVLAAVMLFLLANKSANKARDLPQEFAVTTDFDFQEKKLTFEQMLFPSPKIDNCAADAKSDTEKIEDIIEES